QVEPGVRMEAYLLHPADPPGRLPGVVVFHSTSQHTIHQPAGLEDAESHHLGLHLAQRGFVTVCPRNFIWNYPTPQPTYLEAVAELHRRHPGWRGMGKMLFDGVRAVDYLETLPFVDRERLGCIGHSLGAKETLYAMAFDERLRAGVSSEGGIGLEFTNWEDAWYLGPECRAVDFGHEHHELLALAAPRAFLLIGGESADGSRSWPFIAEAKPICDLLGAGDRVGLLTHSSGHSLPPLALQCAYGWLGHFLGSDPLAAG
ncbi:MAG: dienelactone hydrolase, partial [Armatimonadetes bacterium]|nr:dienelactone hydrolase [Armatimonadota bacterium]